jgi:hypothetical protein
LFAAAAGRQLGLEEESLEDLKLAISEACTGAIIAASPDADGDVKLTVMATNGRVLFRLETDSPLAFESASPDVDVIGPEVTQALFDDARVEVTHTGGSAISFSIPVPAGPFA